MKFGEKTKSQMKVDTDPLNIVETNYVEPVHVRMVDIVGFEMNREDDAKEVEGCVMTNETRQATDGVTNMVSLVKPVEGLCVGTNASGVAEGPFDKRTKATKGLRVQFEKVMVAESPSLGINIVDLNQPCLEMEELERCLEMKKVKTRGGYQKAEESLSDYLFLFHENNVGMLYVLDVMSWWIKRLLQHMREFSMLKLGEIGDKKTIC